MIQKIRYCALTTIATSMRSFVLPFLIELPESKYEIFIGCKDDNKIRAEMPKHIHYLPLNIERGLNLLGTVRCMIQLFRFFRKEKIQMVEYGTPNVSFCAAIVSWLARVPIRIYNHWGSRYIGYTGYKRIISIIIEKTAAKFSTDIREQTPKNMTMCISDKIYPKSKVKVIGYGGTVGVDFSKFDITKKQEYRHKIRVKYNIPNDAFIFGDICYIRKDKGSEELITAFRNIKEENVWLIFVGEIFNDDPINEEIMNWAKNNPNVIFTGRVTDVETYVSCFDCMVHPSYREGLGMVLQEAGAMGVPSITTNIPGPSEFGIDGESVLLVEKASTIDLQDKMIMIMRDVRLRKYLSENVYKLVKERYERKKMVKMLINDREDLWAKYTSFYE